MEENEHAGITDVLYSEEEGSVKARENAREDGDGVFLLSEDTDDRSDFEGFKKTVKRFAKALIALAIIAAGLVAGAVGYLTFNDHQRNVAQEKVYERSGAEIEQWTSHFKKLNKDNTIVFQSFTIDDTMKDYQLYQLKVELAHITESGPNGENLDLRNTIIKINKDKSYAIEDRNGDIVYQSDGK